MIEVRVGTLASESVDAVVRPVTAEWAPVTPAMRRFDDVIDATVREQCERLGELPVGSAAITAAGSLPASYLVHAAIRSRTEPVTRAGVRRALVNGLRRIAEWEIESAAMPLLGIGAGGLEPDDAAAVLVNAVREHACAEPHPTRIVVVVDDEYQRTAVRQHVQAAGTGAAPS